MRNLTVERSGRAVLLWLAVLFGNSARVSKDEVYAGDNEGAVFKLNKADGTADIAETFDTAGCC